tara:strand:+ start:422 stop:1111 length:690 start_codon:yes stop_codon:yes gene_type:complete
MCGRKTLSKDIASIIKEMDIEEWEAHNYKPNYNIAPTDFSPVIIKDEKKKAKMMRWGLIPAWSKNEQIGSKMINARLETVLEKPSFSSLVNNKRCIVIADGYYEWAKPNNQPYYILDKKNKILPLAGLWTSWKYSNSSTLFTYTLITTTPANNIKNIHNRMPLVLNPRVMEKWLDYNKFTISECLSDIQNEKLHLKFYPVSKIVNSTKNNSIQNIREEKPKDILNLFPN